MGMPKPKPEFNGKPAIIRHELVLGRSERELFDTMTTAYAVNRVVTPITSLLSSTAGVLLVAGLGLAYLEQYLPEDWPHRTEAQLRDWFDTENIVLGTAGFGIGALIGGLLFPGIGAVPGGFAGAVAGTVTQETAEEAQAAGVPRYLSYGAFGQLVGAARLLKGTIDELQNQ